MNPAIRQKIIEFLKVVIPALLIVIPLRLYIMQTFYVQQVSMEPNFKAYNYLIVNRWVYRTHEPQRGDVVVFKIPQEKDALIKRVIGLPGEHVVVRQGSVYINNQRLNESTYLADSVKTQGTLDVTLGADQYVMLGDNRPMSADSRVFGPITKKQMIGKVSWRLWPIKNWTHYNTSIQYSFE